ncbi:MAG: RNA polymerase sigma factor [Acidimicrobiales bacterium]
MSTPVNAEVVARARGGDGDAFEELVRATYGDAYSLALRLTGNEHDARDAVQEAYLRAFRAIPRFRGEATFSTWLYRITSNCAATLLERRGRTSAQALDTVMPPDREVGLAERRPDHDPEARSLQRSERDRLVAALAGLPDRLRAVVVLRDVYDLPHEAIACELGISTTATKVRLHRARRRLREQLYPMPSPLVSPSATAGSLPATEPVRDQEMPRAV